PYQSADIRDQHTDPTRRPCDLVDETARPGETPAELTLRLALDKARALAERFPNHLIIGSHQVLLLEGRPVSKPRHHAAALDQLRDRKSTRLHSSHVKISYAVFC